MKIVRKGKLVDTTILHCLGVVHNYHVGRSGLDVLADVTGWHRARGMDGCGYHFIVMPSGEIVRGRDVSVAGAHTLGRNTKSIGIALLETKKVDRIGDYYDFFTSEQCFAVHRINMEYDIAHIHGHNDFAKKLCPGFKVVDDVRNWIRGC